jgi:hypothetical protein
MTHKITFHIIAIIFFLMVKSPCSAQDIYQPPALSHPDSWTMIILPDVQTYMKFERNQPVFELMLAWIQ